MGSLLLLSPVPLNFARSGVEVDDGAEDAGETRGPDRTDSAIAWLVRGLEASVVTKEVSVGTVSAPSVAGDSEGVVDGTGW
jgi:hypothetical protein